MQSEDRIRKIGVGLFGAIGDVILSTPLLESLHEAYPGTRISYIVGPGAAPTLENLSLVDEIILWPQGRIDRISDLQVASRIAMKRFDMTVCLTRAPKLALALYASGARTRVGLTPLGADWTLTVPVDCTAEPQHSQHRTGYFLAVATALGIPWPNPIRLHYNVTDPERFHAAELLRTHGIDRGRHTVIAIHPGTSRSLVERRRWPTDNFAALIRHLGLDARNRVVLLGGPDEEDASAALRPAVSDSRGTDFTGQLTPRQVAAVIQQCHLLIHNDSSPLHIAGAVGTPVLGIFGYQNVRLWGPLGPFDRVVRRELQCSPCLPDDPCGFEFECIRKLQPESVINVVDAMLNEIPRPRASQ